MKPVNWDQAEEAFGALPLREQMALIERLVRRMRETAYLEPVDFDRQMDEMANDPAIQRELRMLPLPGKEPTPARAEEPA